jgi:hypothetical protein
MAALDKDHVQFRPHDQSIFTGVDDLTAAMANFVFRMLVKGQVQYLRSSGYYRVMVEKIGIYVRDSYDFNDFSPQWSRPKSWMSQPLGFWSCRANYGGINPLLGRYVNNQDFREWRRRHGRGGDYVVFSDLQILDTHDIFEIARS